MTADIWQSASTAIELKPPPIKELTTGSTFASRYQVIEELGKGGMGKTYKVFDTKIKEKIALKLIKPEIASDRETIERFSNGLKLAGKIRHKNVLIAAGINAFLINFFSALRMASPKLLFFWLLA